MENEKQLFKIDRKLISNVLITLGVLAWVPFIFLVATGTDVSIFPFLGAHLTGVLGGSWLRSTVKDGSEDSAEKNFGRKRKIVSYVLIYLGVLAWTPYFYFKYGLKEVVDITPFLTAHLTGVLSGSALRASVEADRFIKRRQSA
jgi:hypothetical protein